jgi:hypothetical protein
MTRRPVRNRGSALLAVLWLAAALSAIAFTLSMTVRAELDRAALQVESVQAYYRAAGAIEGAMLRMERPFAGGPHDPLRGFVPGQRWMDFPFPGGLVRVEITGDGGKLAVNQAKPEALGRLIAACGVDPSAAIDMALRMLETGGGAPWSRGNLGGPPTFEPRRASFQELEELLALPQITPDLFYGTYERNTDGVLLRTGGLFRNLTMEAAGSIDVHYASSEMMRAAGLAPITIENLIRLREERELTAADLPVLGEIEFGSGLRLGLGGQNYVYTLRAAAGSPNGQARRTVAARVEYARYPTDRPLRLDRWFDNDL